MRLSFMSTRLAVRSIRILVAILVFFGLPLGGYTLYTVATGNFHEVVAGHVFRSAQLSKAELTGKIQRHGIKSVLNLRGKNAGRDWYDDEIEVCKKDGVVHYDVPLSAGKDVSVKRMDALVTILKKAPKPLLIHCESGADRAAFGAALYHLAVEGKSASEADNELTIWYGHLPLILREVQAMDRSFLRYTGYLGAAGSSKDSDLTSADE
jgi:protein tyrosine/serine phosphatase